MAEPDETPQESTGAARKLLKLAQERFGPLSDAEKKLFEAAANGAPAVYSSEDERENDPANAEHWGEERVLQADRLAWLCTDAQAAAGVTHRGVWARGVRVDGELDLMFATLPFPLWLGESALPQGMKLQHASIPALILKGTHTGALSADGMTVDGSVFLSEGFKAQGEVRLAGAHIGGQLDCGKGQFINPDGDALSADQITVDGPVFMRNGFSAQGEVRLLGAHIGGQLDCENGEFVHPEGDALSADGVTVGGSVFLSEGFKAQGPVRLLGAHIGGQLNCKNAEFVHPEGYALSADRLDVGGSVFLREGFKAEGRVCLAGATVGRGLVWTNVSEPEKATLDLRGARIRTLWDEKKSWPAKGKLYLAGLVYDGLDDEAPVDAKSRIDWLQRQPKYQPQPYEQLAAVLKKMGHDEEARKILIEKEKQRGRRGGMRWYARWWHWVFGAFAGYGYRPWRLVRCAALAVLIGWGLFWWASSPGVTPKTGQEALVHADAISAPPACGSLSCLVYSLDVLLPLVDLHQERHWLPNPSGRGEITVVRWPVDIPGTLVRVWLWFEILFGWLLTTLFFASVTGLIQHRATK